MDMLNGFIRAGKEKIKNLRLDYRNSFGWTTDRKLIVIESDDWGGIRVPSKEVYEKMIKHGDRMEKDPFTRYDALESEEDLADLFEVLCRHRDRNRRAPVITANCATANPDFSKIKEADFENYYYEPFTETFKRYPKHGRSLELWKEGIEKRIFYPQLHCREHLHVLRWLNDLRAGNQDVRLAFDHEMISGGNGFSAGNPFAYMDAFNYYPGGSEDLLNGIIDDAFGIFEKALGFRSRSFTACCYVWSDALEAAVKKNGADFLQGYWYQLFPSDRSYSAYRKIRHEQGERNPLGQIYLIRNCSFEPAIYGESNAVDRCLHQIDSAFRKRKPAVICSHRLNYTGLIDQGNRDRNLYSLDQLLRKTLKNWPDAEFLTSVELGGRMASNAPGLCL
jgi:hypothetical protein